MKHKFTKERKIFKYQQWDILLLTIEIFTNPHIQQDSEREKRMIEELREKVKKHMS